MFRSLHQMRNSSMARVVVRIKNGIAESIEGIRTDISIAVRNYDVSDVTEDQLTKDADAPE